jgi:hypothetical protein
LFTVEAIFLLPLVSLAFISIMVASI